MSVKIYLIRHGESLGNAARKILGHTDMGLSDVGIRQAEAAASALADIKFDIIYSSDLKRALQTALPHAELRKMSVIPHSDLREIYVGDWEGKSVPEIIDEYGDVYEKEWIAKFGTFRLPGGESVQEAGERFYNAIVDIAKLNDGKTILVAAHAAVIRAFWGKINGIKPEELAEKIIFPTNASYSLIEYKEGKIEAISYSVDEYLAEVGITNFN